MLWIETPDGIAPGDELPPRAPAAGYRFTHVRMRSGVEREALNEAPWPCSPRDMVAFGYTKIVEPKLGVGEPFPVLSDPVNRPAHYTAGAVECIDAIQAALTPEEFRGFCKGNALKYVWREQHKGGAESLAKAQWYLTRLTKGG